MSTPAIAANSYASLARLTDSASGLGGGLGGLTKQSGAGGGLGVGQDFGSMLKEAVGSVVETGRKSDMQTQSMAAGKANVVDVVTAVAETEVAVNALVSVRDKVVAAYEEIMRMPI
jgi:flagellar hook-basal body complex protein FliE